MNLNDVNGNVPSCLSMIRVKNFSLFIIPRLFGSKANYNRLAFIINSLQIYRR